MLERARLYDRSETEYRRALALDPGPLRGAALMRLAARAKRTADHATAVALFEEAAESGELLALRELAVHHEHKSRDLMAATDAIDRALRWLAGAAPDFRNRRLAAQFTERRERVLRKQGRARAS